jgi:hypothetical protein
VIQGCYVDYFPHKSSIHYGVLSEQNSFFKGINKFNYVNFVLHRGQNWRSRNFSFSEKKLRSTVSGMLANIHNKLAHF